MTAIRAVSSDYLAMGLWCSGQTRRKQERGYIVSGYPVHCHGPVGLGRHESSWPGHDRRGLTSPEDRFPFADHYLGHQLAHVRRAPSRLTTRPVRLRGPVIPSNCLKHIKDGLLQKILHRCGAYYHSADLFYQELWKQRLAQIGMWVLSVESCLTNSSGTTKTATRTALIPISVGGCKLRFAFGALLPAVMSQGRKLGKFGLAGVVPCCLLMRPALKVAGRHVAKAVKYFWNSKICCQNRIRQSYGTKKNTGRLLYEKSSMGPASSIQTDRDFGTADGRVNTVQTPSLRCPPNARTRNARTSLLRPGQGVASSA